MSKNLSLQARLSRRDFAKGLGLIGFGGASLAGAAGIFAWSDLTFAQRGARTGSPRAFEQIPPSVSGITWVHRNGRSAEMFLPETTGAGCAFFDYDNDGWMDIYLVNSGKCDFYDPRPPLRNALYHNNRNGTFTDVTEKAGVAGGGYGMGVAVGDYNGDGFPDLYVTQYGRSILYRNNGNGTFTDVIEKAGVAAPGWASSAVWFDYDNDGRLDLFVGRFVDLSKELNKPCGIHDDGRRHYCIPRIYSPMPSWLFHNNGDGTFTDVSKESGMAKATKCMSGWGLKFFDYDNDGDLDLLLANGNPDDLISSLHGEVTYEEPLMLFHNTGKSFQDVSAQSGPVFGKPMSSRGLALGDFDNDGAVDVLISVNSSAPLLLRNNAGTHNHWLGIHLRGKKSNPDAIGAVVTYQAGDLKRRRVKVGGGSYLSSHDPRMVLGLGNREKLEWLEVKWPLPGGTTQRFTGLPIDRYITIVEGREKWK